MDRQSIRRFAVPALVLVLAVGLVACEGDSPTSAAPLPDVGGSYTGQWTLKVLRKSDGFQKQFVCHGRMTLVQHAPVGSTYPSVRLTHTLSGLAVVDTGCPPDAYDISGSVSASGEIEFTTNSPKPPEGPCPGGKNVHFSGQVFTDLGHTFLPVRGVTTVTCPQFGEHEFTYMIVAKK